MEMNFRQASEIAKQNPGSTIRRGSNGGFVVISEDGSLLAGSDSGVHLYPKESYEAELTRLRQLLDSSTTENTDLQGKIKEFEQQITD